MLDSQLYIMDLYNNENNQLQSTLLESIGIQAMIQPLVHSNTWDCQSIYNVTTVKFRLTQDPTQVESLPFRNENVDAEIVSKDDRPVGLLTKTIWKPCKNKWKEGTPVWCLPQSLRQLSQITKRGKRVSILKYQSFLCQNCVPFQVLRYLYIYLLPFPSRWGCS